MTAEQRSTGSGPPGNPSGSTPAIDAATLAQLEQLDPHGKSQIVLRVLQTYERSLLRSMDEFAAARRTGDLTSIGRLAHTLRSSSASIGALAFSGHCKTIETMVRDGRTEGLEPALEALQIESVRVRAALAAMLSSKGAAE